MSRRRASWAGWLGLVLVAGGCKSSDASSCNNEVAHACSEWSGAISEARKEGCTRMGGVFAAAPCPTARAVGVCMPSAPEAGGGDSRLVFYAPRSAEEGAKACTRAGGRWSVP
jgi:hypothetical protein